MTTSVMTFPSAAANGKPSPKASCAFKVSLSQLPAWTGPTYWSGCAALGRNDPLTIHPLRLPTSEEVADEVEAMWRALDERACARGERRGYNAGHRCWSCRRFVAGPHARCGHCGQEHGGIYHDAYATR